MGMVDGREWRCGDLLFSTSLSLDETNVKHLNILPN